VVLIQPCGSSVNDFVPLQDLHVIVSMQHYKKKVAARDIAGCGLRWYCSAHSQGINF